jgi:YVTN family beta-propeller protein
MRLDFFCALSILAMLSVSAFADDAPQYKFTKAVLLGAPERWDYVVFDPSSHRVYVAHADHLAVVDGHSGSVIGSVGTFPGGTHGTAIVSAVGRGYTDDGRAGLVASFDLKTLKTIKQIPAEPDADGAVYDPVSGHVFIVDGDSGKITVIDPTTDDSIATIDGGGGLETPAVDGHGRLFVNGAEHGELIVIDTKTNSVTAHWPMPTCERPHGLAIDPKTKRVFASCTNGVLVVVASDTGSNIATLPIGKFTDAAAFDPKRNLIFSSNGDGTVTVIKEFDPNRFRVVETIQTARGARTMAVDPDTGRLYLVAADIDKIDPPETPGGRPRVTYVPNTTKLLFFDPQSP